MALTLLKTFLDPKKNWLAGVHKKAIANRLTHYGLRYDDLYDPLMDLDIKEALNRLPVEVVDARNQRLKRAMDLSMKHEYLSPELQKMQTPFRTYLSDMLALVKRENAEREALGALPLYQRQIP
ncbi:hypothetical protein MKW98_007541 [Papaver atlanticum]|uniref:Cytochrome b-c1 complex subunit 7 n=1 Tax=Papaver atlanticum TaxID=357466 RepID=A0AAD4XCZ4_9MAGN|nr:hypothetical protein MKW98_007541 [Papaver atlanticum]